MKILHINKFHYLRGGAERHYFDVMALLEEKGHEVINFSMQDDRNEESPYSDYFVSNITFDPPNFKTVFKAGRVIYSREARAKLTQLIADTEPDVAHVHLMYHQLSPSVLLALRDMNIPTVMTIHDWQALNPNYSLAVPGHVYSVEEGKRYWHIVKERAIKNSFLMSGLAAFAATIQHGLGWYEKTVTKYIAPTEFAKDLFVDYGWREDQVTHIPHFVAEIPALTKKKKESYLLYAGRLSWEKGIDTLVKYWGDNNIPYNLKIAGRGPLERKLKRLIDLHGLEDRVELLGFVDPAELQPLMQQAAAIVVPSVVYETFGLTIVEAWAAGTAVLANWIGPFPELIGDSRAGELFSWERDDLGAVLDGFMSDEKKWVNTGKKGHNLVKKRYSKEVYYRNIMEVYESIT